MDAGARTASTADAGVALGAGDAPTAAAEEDAGSTPAHPPVLFPGRCVDPVADAKARGHWPKEADLAQAPERVDLDGDGVDDFIFTVGANATDYSGYVYIARGACGIMVLSWTGSAPVPTQTRTRGVLDLEVGGSPCKPSCCPKSTFTTYRWSGKTYERGATRTTTETCEMP